MPKAVPDTQQTLIAKVEYAKCDGVQDVQETTTQNQPTSESLNSNILFSSTLIP